MVVIFLRYKYNHFNNFRDMCNMEFCQKLVYKKTIEGRNLKMKLKDETIFYIFSRIFS